MAFPSTTSVTYAAFAPEHLAGAQRLTEAAGWPHRIEDLALVLAVSAGRVALDDAGGVVGTALCTRYGSALATINTINVAASLRGRGIGRALTEWALAAAGGRPCELVATPQGQPLYASLGFAPIGEIAQHQGELGPARAAAGTWAEPADLDEIVRLDRLATGCDRSGLIAALQGAGRFAVSRRAGRLAACAGVRRFGRGWVAGPVVAGDEAAARALLAFVFAAHAGQFMRVDTGSATLRPFLAEHGLGCVDVATLMRHGPEPARAATATCFALASQALG